MTKRAAFCVVLALSIGAVVSSAHAAGHREHTVYSGQTLGMIAKRYNVSIAALCTANEITRGTPIHPGQKLVVPGKDDPTGEKARRATKPERAPRKTAPPSRRKAEARVHTVARGHTLGKIAKRYHVTVEALCHANDIERTAAIRPGQKLIVPAEDDQDGSRARILVRKGALKDEHDGAKPEDTGEPKVHVVRSGHTLGRIADRYHVSVRSLCTANRISRSTAIQPGQRLIVPASGDATGERARALLDRGYLRKRDKEKVGNAWKEYRKTAWRAGYVVLKSGTQRWRGYVLGPNNTLLRHARERVSDVLASWRTGKRIDIDARLIRTIAQVSDTFGGRPVHVVSGFREHSHSRSSKHPLGRALDFSVEGVPNWAVRDYLRTLEHVGVGYYPNSTFVHVDVRAEATYWVDYSGPGEPPRYASGAP